MELETQFMFGDDILVCPKLTEPAEEETFLGGHGSAETRFLITCYLPRKDAGYEAFWYFWYDGVAEEGSTNQFFTRELPDEHQGIWVRGGSIIPILKFEDASSLLDVIDNDVSLRVYLDYHQQADGHLYLDDGESQRYRSDLDYVSVDYKYEGDTLKVKDREGYNGSTTKIISSVTIYGVKTEPSGVQNLYDPTQHVQFTYNDENKSLLLEGFEIPVDCGLAAHGSYTDLLKLTYPSAQEILL